jgi:hypothetical protein
MVSGGDGIEVAIDASKVVTLCSTLQRAVAVRTTILLYQLSLKANGHLWKKILGDSSYRGRKCSIPGRVSVLGRVAIICYLQV